MSTGNAYVIAVSRMWPPVGCSEMETSNPVVAITARLLARLSNPISLEIDLADLQCCSETTFTKRTAVFGDANAIAAN
jgi:hypothetical protein